MTSTDLENTGPGFGPQAKTFHEFQTLAEAHGARGPFLEVVGGPRENSILLTDYFNDEERHVVGPNEDTQNNGVIFHRGSSNDMRALFEDGQFNCVIWNAGLAHDKFFWLTLDEIRRVLAPGGLLLVGAPGFSKTAKFGVKVVGPKGNAIAFTTVTPRVHAKLPDFWRISPQAMRQVLLAGFDVREVRVSLLAPRVFGAGVKHG